MAGKVDANTEFNWVTSQIARAVERSEQSFRMFLQTFSALVAGSVWLSLQPGISEEARHAFIGLGNIVVGLASAAATVLIAEGHRTWRSFRLAQRSLTPHVPSPRFFPAGLTWLAMLLCVWGAFALFCAYNPFRFVTPPPV